MNGRIGFCFAMNRRKADTKKQHSRRHIHGKLFRFEQISHCGHAKTTYATGEEDDSKVKEASEHDR